MQIPFCRLPFTTICVVLLYQLISAVDISTFNSLTNNTPSRIVWLQGGDVLEGGGALIGYDSKSNTTAQILAASPYQNRPIICRGGNSVVVSINYVVYIVNWDGTGKKKIVDGFCSDVWKDGSGQEWAVVRQGGENDSGRVFRYLINDTTKSVELTDLPTRIYGFPSMNWYQLSGDGLLGVDFIPWPFCIEQIFKLPAQQTDTIFRSGAEGCWSSVASDSSHYWFCFSSTGLGHTGLLVFKNSVQIGDFLLNAAPLPANSSTECYHPRFASKGGNFLTFTAGYSTGGSLTGTPEVYFGKFNDAHNGFSTWVRMTTNSIADYCPDAWVGVDSAASILLGQSQLRFVCNQGGTSPAAQTVTATASYGTLSNVKVVSNQTWLTVNAQQQGNGSYTITNTVATTLLASGQYNATVTVSGTSLPSNMYNVQVVVNGTEVPTAITIDPSAASLPAGNLMKFTAVVLDQRDSLLSPQPAIQWSLVPPGAGTLVNGSLTAGATTGPVKVIVQSGTLADTALINIVTAAPLSILAPAGGVYCTGTVLHIKWASAADVPGVTIQVSPDNGKDYYLISLTVLPSSSQWEDYAWTIPAGISDGNGNMVSLVSSQVRVQIFDYSSPSSKATSAPFTITNQNAVLHGVHSQGTLAIRYESNVLDITMPVQQRATIEIYTLEGKLVSHSVYNTMRIFQTLPRGNNLYIMRFSAGSECDISRFVKNQ